MLTINRAKRPIPLDRHLEISTNGRAAFIAACETLAKAIPTHLLHDSGNIPQIEIKGAFASGKSLLVEVMMKTWSDDHTLADVHDNEMRYMFLEKKTCDAIQTVSNQFNVESKKTALIFNSSFRIYQVLDRLLASIPKNKSLAGGAIFFNVEPIDEWPNAWLRIDIPYADLTKNWERSIRITVENLKLWNDPQFQKGWAELQKLSTSSPTSSPAPKQDFA